MKCIGLTRKAASIHPTYGRTAMQAGIIAALTNTHEGECMKSLWMAALLLVGSITAAEAAVVAKEIDYKANGAVMKGYLAYDDKIKGKRPGVLVVHEKKKHNNNTRKRARMLAELGYTARALD